ncbi:MAG: PQQ-binding-like beta-propeller repeat protein [Chthoniobacteraceae bacterium]
MENDDDPSRRVDWFEPATGAWGRGPLLPDGSLAGFGMAACAAKGELLASPLSGKIHALSADQQSWEEIGKLAKPRFFHRLLPLAVQRLVAVGGSSRKGQIPELELVDLDAKPATAAIAPAPTGTAAKDVKAPSEPSGGASWPQWRGANRDGISSEAGWRKDWPAGGPRSLWRVKVGEGMSSSVVVDGRLFTQGNDGEDTENLFALDAATGEELWKHSIACATAAHAMPIVPNGPGATPTVVEMHIFALTREGDLVCIETNTGKLAWRKNLVADLGGKRPVYGYAQSPLVEGGTVFVDLGAAPGKTGSTAALDAATGEVRWKSGTGEAGYSSARGFTCDGRRYVAMFKGEALDVFDPRDGRVVWSHRTTARDFTNTVTPVFVAHRILVSNTGTDEAALLDWDAGAATNVRAAWTHKQFALLFNTAIPHDGCLFAFNEKRRGHHEFTCVDAATGVSRWVSDAVPTSTFILADGHWLFLTRDGEVVIAPTSIAELKPGARFKAVEGRCYATPTLANGRLYVRTNAGDLAAFDLRASAQARR